MVEPAGADMISTGLAAFLSSCITSAFCEAVEDLTPFWSQHPGVTGQSAALLSAFCILASALFIYGHDMAPSTLWASAVMALAADSQEPASAFMALESRVLEAEIAVSSA